MNSDSTGQTLKDKLASLQSKAKERTVKTQNIEYDLETLVKKISKNVIRLDPDYQRRHRWDEATSSRLIESLILNIPIPLIYISQDVDVDTEDEEQTARYSVIDGQQRLTAIRRYLGNEFQLQDLDVLSDLNGSLYRDLPPFLVRRLEERTIRCLRIDSTVDAQVKYDIFERLNSGAVKLEPQELRNAVSRGPFNELIKQLATNSDFRVLLQIDPNDPMDSKKVQKMEDVELVLRFFALIDGHYLHLAGGFRRFLSDEMDRYNQLDSAAHAGLAGRFEKTMRLVRTTFGDKAFAKYKLGGDGMRLVSRFNAAVFDALATAVAMKVDLPSKTMPDGIAERFRALFGMPEFAAAVEGSVNDKGKLTARIEAVQLLFT